MQVLTSTFSDPSRHAYSHVIYGALKLLVYTLNYSTHSYDQTMIFSILLKDFFFNKQGKRIKHETTMKLLHECVKKILFTEQNLIEMMV